MWTRAAVWLAAQKAERRSDAREARFFDISWPRQLPLGQIEHFVDAVYGPFAAMGLAVQVDWESSAAVDGERNDHLHAMISTRQLSNDGFSERKCRELDTWFRAGVRRRVAEVFSGIAQECALELLFDPDPNIGRLDALPPEDRIARSLVRNNNSALARRQLERRDLQRRIRTEHAEIMARIETLQRERRDLETKLEARFEIMAVLTAAIPIEGRSAPLPLDEALAAVTTADIEVTGQVEVKGLGLMIAIGTTTIVDRGSKIYIDGPLEGTALRAALALGRRKKWSEFSLVNSFGMPMPLPAAQPGRSPSAAGPIGRDVVLGIWPLIDDVRSGTNNTREQRERIDQFGSRNLRRLMKRLMAHPNLPPSDDSALTFIEDLLADTVSDIWARFSLGQEIVSMSVPGHHLSRPFRPPARFYQEYGVPPASHRIIAERGER